MKIPKQVKINGHYYSVNIGDLDSEELGFCKPSENCISINTRKQARSQQEETLLHEIIEAINFNNELKLEHPQITALSTTLYQVLKDNNFLPN